MARHSPPVPKWRLHSIRRLDAELASAGLEKLDGITLGFGPLSFLGFRILTMTAEVKIHCKLQELADRGTPLIRAAGVHYLVLARKNGAKAGLNNPTQSSTTGEK
jgi:hypothetical protein